MKKILVTLLTFTVLNIFAALIPANTSAQCGEFGGGNFPDNLICTNGPYCGIRTALGCFPVGTNQGDATTTAARFIYMVAIGLGSGISLLLIIYAGITIITSSGNPQKLDAGKQLLTAAIAGLVLIILSVTILRIIGANILDLPQF